MSDVFTIEVDDVCPLLNTWQRMHWSARKRYMEGLSWRVLAAMRAIGWERRATPIDRCCIQIERLANGPLPDWDGLAASGKPLLDTLVVNRPRNPHGLGVIEDDNPAVVEGYAVFPGKSKTPRTIVRIYRGPDRVNRFLADYDKKLRGELGG